MKLKSLLLGSAAVLVGATGVKAADAIIVEPEPVEYVRVCDAYGAGWWYIPGTETCIKFDGDIRVEYATWHYHDYDSSGGDHEVRYRARLNVRANNETEYGTLASRIRFVGGDASAPTSNSFSSGTSVYTAGVTVDWAVISLAGFRVGYSENYWTSAGNYGYYDGRYDGLYNAQDAVYLDYTWASAGWAATIGAQVGYAGWRPWSISGTPGSPDIYGGLTYTSDNWYLAGIVYYDSSQASAAYKLRADYDFGNGFGVGGWYMFDDGETDYAKGHAWGVTAKLTMAEKLTLIGGYSDYADQDGVGGDMSQTNWTVALKWDVVPGLYILPEYSVTTFENEASAGASNYGVFNVRIVRDF